MKFNELAKKVKATVAPSNADRYEKAKKMQAKNEIMREKVKSMEAVAKQHTERRELQARAQKARAEMQPSWMKQDRPSSQKVAHAHKWGSDIGKRDPFEAFNSPLFTGSTRSSSHKKGKKQEADFPDFNFL